MAYPKQARQENPNQEYATKAADVQLGSVGTPQVQSPSGGAPTVRANESLKKAWGMTGSPSAMYDRVLQRNQTGTDPGVVADSLRKYWSGAAGGGDTPILAPPTMPLEQAQKYLSDLSAQLRAALDERMKSISPDELASSRFWRGYQDYPEQMAALTARRLWTNRVTGSGPVADWLKWLGG